MLVNSNLQLCDSFNGFISHSQEFIRIDVIIGNSVSNPSAFTALGMKISCSRDMSLVNCVLRVGGV